MFQLSKTPKRGMCPAKRCPQNEGAHADCPYKICDLHYVQWIELGRPDLLAPSVAAPAATVTGPGTGLAPVSPAQIAKLETERQSALAALKFVTELPLGTQAEMDAGGKMLGTIRTAMEQADEERMSIARPLLDAKNATDKHFKPRMDALKACYDALNARLEDKLREAKTLQLAALTKVEEAGGNADENTLMVAHGTEAIRAPAEGVAVRQVWTFEITNVEELIVAAATNRKELQRFLLPNFKMLQAHVANLKEECLPGGLGAVPGVRFFQDVQMNGKVST